MTFWESFENASGDAIETMGEPLKVKVDGEEIDAVVLPMAGTSGFIPGGVKQGVEFQLYVKVEVCAPADGKVVEARGQTGRLNVWEFVSAGYALWTVGPKNRWDGDIPGM